MIFEDRYDAGRQLAEKLLIYRHNAIVLAIPRGGVPVGYEIAKRLDVPLDLIIPRKLPIPSEPEAGFGAVAPDGTIVLNEEMVAYLGLTSEDIGDIAAEVLNEVRRRIKVYRGDRPLPHLKGKRVILVDDGLATGYTMIAAVRAVRNERPARVIVAVPCSPETSVLRLEKEANEVFSLAVQRHGSFAVASFYGSFPDLSDEEVKGLLHYAPEEPFI
jgi:putative phosphoribosyl transferase